MNILCGRWKWMTHGWYPDAKASLLPTHIALPTMYWFIHRLADVAMGRENLKACWFPLLGLHTFLCTLSMVKQTHRKQTHLNGRCHWNCNSAWNQNYCATYGNVWIQCPHYPMATFTSKPFLWDGLLLIAPKVIIWAHRWMPNEVCIFVHRACQRSLHTSLSKQGSTPVDKSFTARSQNWRARD